MAISLTVTGLKEMIADVKSSRAGIPSAIYVAVSASLKEIQTEIAKYPPQKAPADPKRIYIRGKGMKYIPTGRIQKTSEQYGKTTTIRVLREGNNIVGFVNSKASYASYIRGELDGKGQAWMHVGVWPTLKSIVDEQTPLIKVRVDVAVQDYLKRNGL